MTRRRPLPTITNHRCMAPADPIILDFSTNSTIMYSVSKGEGHISCCAWTPVLFSNLWWSPCQLGEPGVESTTSGSAAQHNSRSADVASRSRYAFRWTKKQQGYFYFCTMKQPAWRVTAVGNSVNILENYAM
ncbi:uncharacterized protein [Dermacentor andersoni]|uniref:uncharacterized protein isoform X4 n=1 Tax=Dermacentor andersoni TaxID=34620 RepID=UPI003B3AD35C